MKMKCLVQTLILLAIWTTSFAVIPVFSEGAQQGPKIDMLRFKVLKGSEITPPYEFAYVDHFTSDYTQWTPVGTPPYLDAANDGNYIEGTYDAAWMAWFGFQDINLEGKDILQVVLEGYTNGPYNVIVDYDVYTADYTWLGSLYATGSHAWVTPRWIGTDTVDTLYPEIKTQQGFNDFKVLIYFYDPGHYGGPGNMLDALRLKVTFSGEAPYEPSPQVIGMRTGEIDAVTDLIRPGDIETLNDECFTITSAPEFHIGHIGFNIRPDQNYRSDRPPGELPYVAAVLSDVNFRHALIHAYDQDRILATIYKYVVTKSTSLVPQAQGGWMSTGVPQHPYNPGDPFTSSAGEHSSVGILKAAGYTFVDADSSGTVTSFDYWTKSGHGGMPLPTLKLFTPTYEVAPTSAEHGAQLIQSLRSIGLNNMVQVRDEFGPYIAKVFGAAEFDLYMAFWSLDRFPDHLYNMLHSSQDSALYPWRYNAPGLNDAYVDTRVETLKFSLSHPDALVAAHEVQEWLYSPENNAQAFPYLQMYSKANFNAFNSDLGGIINSPGFGSQNLWTFLNMHWEPGLERTESGRTIVGWCIGDEPERLNPVFASTDSAWSIMNSAMDSLIGVNPYRHADRPWLADSWTVTPTATGMEVTFDLANGVEWQDGNAYTAEDAQFNWQFLRDNAIPRYTTAWEHIVDVQVITPGAGGVVKVVLDVTSMFLLYDLADTAALLPPPVWAPLNGAPLPMILGYDPILVTTKPAGAGPRFGAADGPQNHLYGTGPYIIQYYDPVGQYADLYANRHYWKTAEEVDNQIVEMFWECGDYDRNGIITEVDKFFAEQAYGYSWPDPEYDPNADFNSDGIVDIRDLSIMAHYFLSTREAQKAGEIAPTLVQEEKGFIELWDLNTGFEKQLTGKLDDALILLEQGNINGAIHKLQDLITKATNDAKYLTPEQRDFLIQRTQEIIDLIA